MRESMIRVREEDMLTYQTNDGKCYNTKIGDNFLKLIIFFVDSVLTLLSKRKLHKYCAKETSFCTLLSSIVCSQLPSVSLYQCIVHT